jgi:hypothetical protein
MEEESLFTDLSEENASENATLLLNGTVSPSKYSKYSNMLRIIFQSSFWGKFISIHISEVRNFEQINLKDPPRKQNAIFPWVLQLLHSGASGVSSRYFAFKIYAGFSCDGGIIAN